MPERRLFMPALNQAVTGRHFVTVEQALKALRVSRPTLYGYINSGRIRSVKLGLLRRIPSDEIERLLDGKGFRPRKAVPDRHPNPVTAATSTKTTKKVRK